MQPHEPKEPPPKAILAKRHAKAETQSLVSSEIKEEAGDSAASDGAVTITTSADVRDAIFVQTAAALPLQSLTWSLPALERAVHALRSHWRAPHPS